MRYLVTGGGGFIGTHLTDLLLRKGHSVVAYDRVFERNTTVFFDEHPNEYVEVVGDVRDSDLLNRMVEDTDVVVHLAGIVGVERVIENPLLVYEVNLIGSQNVMKACLEHGKRMLQASSSEVFGVSTDLPFSEQDSALMFKPSNNRRWMYAVSKWASELLGMAYDGLDFVAFRPFNFVGPFQTGKYGMVVPRFVSKALKNEEIEVYGNGKDVRCFCHVRDAVEAIYALAEDRSIRKEVFNIGNADNQRTMLEFAKEVVEVIGSKSVISVGTKFTERGVAGQEIHDRIPDVSRIHKVVGWRASRDVKTIIQDVAESMR